MFTIRFVLSIVTSIIVMTFSLPHFAFGAASDIIASMSANSWKEVDNTQLADVAPSSSEYPFLASRGTIKGLLAWSGAAFNSKQNQLVVWGGGHADYLGNELYAFDVNNLRWIRLTNPSQPNLCNQINNDGTPNSRHTYNGLAYIEHANRLFASGGALACLDGGCGADMTWVFNFSTNQWTNRSPSHRPHTQCENLSVYDPETKKVWWFDGITGQSNGLWSYDYDSNQWTKHNSDLLVRRTAVVDTNRGFLVVVGKGEVLAYDIRNSNFTKQIWNTTGGSSFISQEKPGLAYDPTTDRIVGWAGGSVYALNLETKVWSSYNASGAPTPNPTGVFGLWRYVPNVNAFIVVSSVNNNVHFYKFSTGLGAPPDPSVDITPPAAPTNLQGTTVTID